MPRRELKEPRQVDRWLVSWGRKISGEAEMILIGSGALLWHAHERGLELPLPESSMDVDPITENEELAMLGYDAMIGSEFEREHGWHVNLMPPAVLREFPPDWRDRCSIKKYGLLTVVVPSPEDLLVPKRRRGEPRDIRHGEWAAAIGLVQP